MIYVFLSVNNRLLIIINNRHDIKQSVEIITSNKQSRFRNHQIHHSFLQFFMNWSDDDSTRDFSKFNFLKICWIICLNRSTLCDRMLSWGGFCSLYAISAVPLSMLFLRFLYWTSVSFRSFIYTLAFIVFRS